ncbi:hypothetical protein FISHEDRAFT_70835 [Fistulina hepatica ATCC 64428]|uniref:Survival Motor Neuron Gemin2-binding domain-containing protein n=1 Tax=Fistulina hepatica ATCC 64428 TaxID=1128425 RepID=A0A0D7AIS1_9AGAR|nr:hypothetical protein FISHEDRAFT_70835 [Fistulina hepatica ATCC 64428]
MAGRQVVSYDDITLPYTASASSHPAPEPSSQPPAKRQKSSHAKQKQLVVKRSSKSASANTKAAEKEPEFFEEESRDLTHDEIWDDSALIEAWNAANEEYEAYHGPDHAKAWKTQPVRKHNSALWYNIPPDPKTTDQKTTSTSRVISGGTPDEVDSKPLDFDSFVPTYDASLNSAMNDETLYNSYTDLSSVTSDEAFTRAVQASYWSGYWTAVYQLQRKAKEANDHDDAEDEAPKNGEVDGQVEGEEIGEASANGVEITAGDDDDIASSSGEADGEELVPAQR